MSNLGGEFHSLEIKSNGKKLEIEGTQYTEHQFLKNIPTFLSKKNICSELVLQSLSNVDQYNTQARDLFHSLLKEYRVYREEATVQYMDIPNSNNLELVCDIKTGINYVLDTNKNILRADISTAAFWAKFTGGERKEIEKASRVHLAHCIFNPQESRGYYKIDEDNYLNKYRAPIWKDLPPNKGKTNNFKSFLKHLFKNDKKQIDFVMNWLYRLMTSRNETALVLNGDKGVGKNILYAVAKALVGQEYCAEAPKKFGEKEFNDIFRDRILILMDEHRITKDKYNFLKASFNEWQTIEAKGKNIASTEKVFINFMIFHNSPEDIYLENAERRFAVMDITDKVLTEEWERKRIEQFYKSLNDPSSEEVAAIGNYILNYGKNKEQDPFSLYLGEKYQEILDCHVSTLIHSVIDLIEKNRVDEGEISGTVINTNCFRLLGIKMACKGPRARTLIKEYKYRNKYSLGEVNTGVMPWRLIVNPDLLDLVEKEGE